MPSTESSVAIYGVISAVLEVKTAPGGHKLAADYWELLGFASSGEADSELNADAESNLMLNWTTGTS